MEPAPCIGRQNLNNRSTREVQVVLSSVSWGILLSGSGTNYPSGLKDMQMTDDQDCILTQILFVIACFAALGVWDCCLEEQKRWRERATKTSIFIGTFLLCSGPYVITSLVPSNDAQNKTVSGKMWLGTSV
ncbi:uncharacterized protein LOC122703381 isoform X2 [Cervus elaphus]|uniref:uncharacterized protein LOC122703381 isoform X2 n=1 Tax=Cervus elaphus TaxID=9860 RepID=UPI001CC2AC0D|nr:uncharacterized protein LOC122703381 isoform X2 [Cervus elaphus]